MTTRNKREAKDYAVEKVVQTVRVLEALQGDGFEPVTIEQIIERIGFIAGLDKKLKFDAVRRILLTLELLGYAAQTNRKWTIGKNFIRFSQSVARNQV